MLDFVTRIRATTLMARGIAEPRLLNTPTELDRAIIKLAGRILPKSEKIVFFFAYGCTPTVDDIAEFLYQHLKKDYEPQTIQEYLKEAHHRIHAEASTSLELNEWQTKFFKSPDKNLKRH